MRSTRHPLGVSDDDSLINELSFLYSRNPPSRSPLDDLGLFHWVPFGIDLLSIDLELEMVIIRELDLWVIVFPSTLSQMSSQTQDIVCSIVNVGEFDDVLGPVDESLQLGPTYL